MSHTVCMPRCVLVAVIFGSALWGALVGANLVSGFAQAEPEPEALPAYEQGRGITWAYVNAYQGAVLDGRCPVCDHVNYALDYSGAGQVVPCGDCGVMTMLGDAEALERARNAEVEEWLLRRQEQEEERIRNAAPESE
jgi:hypothetical protein